MSESLPEFGAELKLGGLGGFLNGVEKAGKEAKKTGKELEQTVEKATETTKKKVMSTREQFRRLGDAASGTVKVVGRAVKGLGLVGAAAFAAGAMAVHKYGQFELSVARIGTLLGRDMDAMKDFGATVLDSAGRFGTNTAESADAIFQAISAGIPATRKDVESFNELVGKASVGAFASQATVVDGLTTVLNAYGLKVEDATRVSDAFFTANKLGKTTFGELAASIGTVAPMATNLKVSYDELLGSVVTMTKAGVTTNVAMTSIRAALSSIQMATGNKKAQDEAKRLGIEFSVAALKAKGFTRFMQEVTQAINGPKGTAESLSNLFSQVESQGLIARLASASGMKDFMDTLSGITAASGATEEAFSKVSNTIGFKLRQLTSGFERFAIKAGEGLATGFGLDKIQDVPAIMERAGESIRTGSQQFAEGFTAAFKPAFEFAGMDLDKLANNLGKSAGNMASAFKSMLEQIAAFVGSDAFAKLVSGLGTITGFVAGSDPMTQAITRTTGSDTVILKDSGTIWKESQMKVARIAAERQARGLGMVPPSERFGQEDDVQALRLWARREFAQATMSQTTRFSQGEATRYRERRSNQIAADAANAEDWFQSQGRRATLADPDAEFGGNQLLEWNVQVNLDSKTVVNDEKGEKKGGGGRSFSARGRGDGVVESSMQFLYVLSEDRLIPISDQFTYGALLSPSQGSRS